MASVTAVGSRSGSRRKALVAETSPRVDGILNADKPRRSPAHDMLVSIYQNPGLPIRQRLRAAAAAIGYEKPRLAVVKHSGAMMVSHEEALAELEVALGLEVDADRAACLKPKIGPNRFQPVAPHEGS